MPVKYTFLGNFMYFYIVMSEMKKSFLLLHSAILLASFSGILCNLVSMDAVLITWYRMLLACAVLFAICVAGKQSVAVTHGDRKTLAAGFLLALHWTMFYGSIKYANVSVGVVCFCMSGFFTAIISPLVNRKHISLAELLLSSVTLLGISLIFRFETSSRTGIIFGVVSALLFAVYATLNERINASGNVMRTTMLQMLGGTVGLGIFLPLYMYFKPSVAFFPTLGDFGYLFLLAFGCTVCMCGLLNKAQKNISAFTVSLSFNLEPVYSIGLAILIFREDRMFGPAFYAGLSMIVLSLLLQTIHMMRSEKIKMR